jgi:[protein-PII] uridylyltransferase
VYKRQTIVESRRAERRQYGETVYMLEPNVKRSRGGLRDVQMVRWVGFARYGHSELESLFRSGALTRDDRNRLLMSVEFLLRLRNELHFHAGRAQDLLTRDEQVRLAELYQCKGSAGVLPVEQFMRDYFEYTGDVRYIAVNFVAGLRARTGLLTKVAPLFTHRVDEDFRVGPIHIGATNTGLAKVTSDLAEVMRIMELANAYNKRIDHRTWEAIRNAMVQRKSNDISPAAVQRFLSLLSQPGRLGPLLHRLHELRVLEKILPAMQHARCRVQFNDYHKFTIDEHSLRSVERATEFLNDPRPVGDAYRDLRDKRLLHLALLLHDLGKGYDEDHCEVGRRIAAETARRLGLSPHDTELLSLLVHKHLLMPHTAFRQDMRDESVAVRLAVEVGSPEVLQMLFILSCADLAAVGPGVLNDWKLELLTELYERTRQYLTSDEKAYDKRKKIGERRQMLRKLVGEENLDEWWEQQIAHVPSRLLMSDSAELLRNDLEKLREVPAGEAAAWARYIVDRKATVFTVGTSSHVTPGLFHKLTGTLSAKGLQILSAEISTLANDLVLDRFYVQDNDYEGKPPQDRLDSVCQALVKSLTTDAEKPPAFRKVWSTGTKSPAAQFSGLPTRIRFDNTTSERYTIITIFNYDRMGLLYTIARTLFELDLDVHFAKIGTYLDQVVDVFYVTGRNGRKIHQDERQAEIRERLTRALEPENRA